MKSAINFLFAWIPACFMDGSIFFAIAICGAIVGALGSDDAAKWIDPKTLWFMRNAFFAGLQGLLAIKAFRSTSYGDARRKTDARDIKAQDAKDAQANNLPDNVTKSDVAGKAGSGS